ncbi:putative bifunctional diguanylate cyclase/phosphodiesterase [Halorhodospira halophila]|uniref:Diguanylate cyclase/phosphodiesterase with PAS/PAC sensor(S) n=1 Tax=Halorhodospira halophila (strain DSM 244 / SL1) TaxID=349124 RepID=A1WXR7_HALHL|nr:GGDEF and EAL domain-containing protein [Halorhodospira halophila]ABM62479.1 diguanylate cyclase/phosphodiesterase with PAS/PAC sensor(s) [Halorhodospira halophila SL1]MBK1728158.1 GGDEF domain-containing protein [Halorhodospira halophila]
MGEDERRTLSPEALREAARRRLERRVTDVSDWSRADTQSLVAELELHQQELRIQNEELQQARDRLETALDRYHDLFQRAPVGYLLLDDEGRIWEANRAAADLLAPGGDLTGQLLSDFVAVDAQDALYLHWRALTAARAPQAVELTLAWAEGASCAVRMESSVEPTADRSPCRFRCALMDITERRRSEEQLRIAARVFEDAGDAIVVTDPDGHVQTINNAFTRITGYTEGEALGNTVCALLDSGRHSEAFHKEKQESLDRSGYWQGEIWHRRKGGELYPEWLTINRIDDATGQPQHFVAVFSDITQLKDAHSRSEYLANHDPLTGLPNRSLFQDRLQQAIAQTQRHEGQVGLMFLDLDHFKTINDTLGHEVGDELLVQVAERLGELVRDVDTVARIGGDEFTVVLTDCDPEEVGSIAQRLVEGLGGTFVVDGRELQATPSAGLALYPRDGEDVHTLCKAADMAMYRAKEDGRNRLRLCESGLHQRLLKDTALEEALRRALTQGELRLVYQPQFDASDPGRVVGAEALLRWHDPASGPISPGRFIPIAERSDLILELDRRVEELLCEQLNTWSAGHAPPAPISFNVSAKSFRQGHWTKRLFRILSRYGVAAEQLQVEFAEGTLSERAGVVPEEIRRLHEGGIALAIDDFGTGFTSLVNLKQLPLAELKIDQSFVAGLGQDEDAEAIVRASLAVAEAMGLRTVAEGVETQRQLTWLQEQGCQRIQGSLLSAPLEAEDFEALIRGTQKPPQSH